MLRPKRTPHASAHTHHAHTHADEHHGSGAATASDELLATMNPSLMTERQQLAFLLRTTAQDASATSSSGSSDAHESSGDEQPHVGTRARTPRRIQRTNKTSPRNGHAVAGAHGSRTRAPKSEPKSLLSPRSASAALKKAASEPSGERAPMRKRLKVKTAASASPHTVANAVAATGSDMDDKTSPSSSSDVLHMAAFSENTDFWSRHCALCCDRSTLAVACDDAMGSDALFLCPSCDQKYPTQRALGRV